MFFQGQEVLVTGAAGLIGCNLVGRLLSEGANVRATLHSREPAVVDDRIQYIKCDLREEEDCGRAVERMRYVFHCAAITGGAAYMAATPISPVTPNMVMDSRMLQAAYDAKVEKFVWLGSSTSYPPSGDRPIKEEELFDGEPYSNYYFVGWMKRFAEILCRMYGEKLAEPMTTIVLRPSNVYGPHDDYEPATSHVTPALIRKVIERQDPMEVWGTGDDVRDLIYVDDMVEAMVVAMEKVKSYAAFNVALGKGYSVKEVLQTILEVDGYTEAKIVLDPSKPSMIPIRLLDTAKAEKELGFRAKTDLREGIAKTIEWYRQSRGIARLPAAS